MGFILKGLEMLFHSEVFGIILGERFQFYIASEDKHQAGGKKYKYAGNYIEIQIQVSEKYKLTERKKYKSLSTWICLRDDVEPAPLLLGCPEHC